MISRRTTLLISNMVCDKFTTKTYSPYDLPSPYSDGDAECLVDANNLRDFLFEFNVDGYTIDYLCLDYLTKESLKEYILNMHTGRFYSTQNYK